MSASLCSIITTSASKVGSSMELSFSFRVGEGAAVAEELPGLEPTLAGVTVTLAIGMPVEPGWSGVIPRRRRTTLRKISSLDFSVKLSSLSTGGSTVVSGSFTPPTAASQPSRPMNAMSLSLVGEPKDRSRAACRSPVVPTQAPTASRESMALSSSAVGSMAGQRGSRTLLQRPQAGRVCFWSRWLQSPSSELSGLWTRLVAKRVALVVVECQTH